MSDQFEGGCLCGAVRFVATGQPKSVAWCHCQSCRKHSGAPVSVFAKCGSTLTCEGEPLSAETHFHVGAFDRAAQLQPTRHIFPEERLPWLHLVEA